MGRTIVGLQAYHYLLWVNVWVNVSRVATCKITCDGIRSKGESQVTVGSD